MTEPPRTLEERLRDFDARPYSPDEARVAAFFAERGTGGGDDPIGAILAGFAWVISERNTELLAAIDAQSQLLAEADEAIWQALDDMGDSHCVCEDTKQQLRAVLAKLKAASGVGE